MAPKSDEKPVELMAETESKQKDKKDKKSKDKKKKGQQSDEIIDDENAMSEEDRELKERLETCVSTLINEANEASVTTPIRLKALDVIVTELRSATSSMTSVPKPLKFLRPKFDVLKEYYGSIEDSEGKKKADDKELLFLRARLGDVLAVLAMTLGKHGELWRILFVLLIWYHWILYWIILADCFISVKREMMHIYFYFGYKLLIKYLFMKCTYHV